MRVVLIAAAAAMFASFAFSAMTPAHAQEKSAMDKEMDRRKAANAAADEAYRAALKGTSRDLKPVAVDPWANAREPTPATGAKK